MTVAYILMWGCMLAFGGSAILALLWAIRNGEFNNLQAGAASIFDKDEPIGVVTDAFPEERR